jgi:hypothetical protein
MVHNYTETDNNGTHIIIKQIFLNVDPDVYVTWDGLYIMLFYSLFWYMVISIWINLCKRRGYCGCKKPDQPVIAIMADAGDVRVINHSEE